MLPGTYRDDDPLGVKRDTLADSSSEVNNAIHQLEDINVRLDSIADSTNGIWTEDELAEVRMLQKTVRALLESKEQDLEDINDEFDELVDE